MNKRIQELFEKSRREKNNFLTNDRIYINVKTDVEKFAELIIRECVQSIEKTIETNCDNGYEKMGCEFAITDMLEHFGVEE